MMTRIIKIDKTTDNDIKQVLLEDGRILSKETAIELADSGQIDDFSVGTTENGQKFLQANDDQEKILLGDLPAFG